MIDEDFIIEESSPLKVLFSAMLFILILSVLGAIYYFYFYEQPIRLKKIEIELGDAPSLDVNDYLKNSGNYEFELDLSKLSLDENGKANSIGEYSYEVISDDESYRGKIYVVDTTPPDVELKELIIGLNEEYELDDFLDKCFDHSVICYVDYANDKDEFLNKTEGTHQLELKISDKHGNSTTKTATLIVDKNASLSDFKASNEEISNITPNDENWDGTYTFKFEKGVLEDSDESEAEILRLSNAEISSLFEEKILKQELIIIFNKYNYILGFSLRLEFKDKNIYLSESEYEKLFNEEN